MVRSKSSLTGKKSVYHQLLVEGYRRLGAESSSTVASPPSLDTRDSLDDLVGEFLDRRARGERLSIRSFCSQNRVMQQRFEQRLRAAQEAAAADICADTTGPETQSALASVPMSEGCSPEYMTAYYGRADVQEALVLWSQGRRMALHFKQGAVRLGIRRTTDVPALAAVSSSAVPTFHASVGRYHGTHLFSFDLVAEVDYKGDWEACFRAVRPLVYALRDAGAEFMVKFSGHSSAHVVLPCKGSDYARASQAFLRRLPGSLRGCGKLDLSFREPQHFLRMPYALHEKTGLVSLPLTAAQFDAFNPAMAKPDAVTVDLSALVKLLHADNTRWLEERW